MVPAQRQILRPAEQNRRPGYEFHTPIPSLFFRKAPKIYNGERPASLTNVAGKSGHLPIEN
jgi:hypothetical protein